MAILLDCVWLFKLMALVGVVWVILILGLILGLVLRVIKISLYDKERG